MYLNLMSFFVSYVLKFCIIPLTLWDENRALMKQLITYIFLLWVCAGCVHSVDERLVRVNSLANCGEPDSAMILLQSMKKSNLNEHNSRYYDLMTIKTRDKAYLDITNDSLIVDLISYFEDEGSIAEKAEAYYYGGRVYREMGDLPQSLDYFQKALDVLADDDSSARLKGKISSQMGQMFMSMYMFEQAKPKLQDAISYQTACNDSIGLMYNYCSLADTYKRLNESDSALLYYTRSLNLSHRINPNGIDDIETRVSIIEFYIRQNDIEKAQSEYKYIEPYINQYFITDYVIMTAININILSKDYIQVEKFAQELSKSKKLESREFAHNVLADLYRLKGDTQKLYKHVIAYKECIDSINSQASLEALIHQNSFYNYSLREKETVRLKDERMNLYIVILITAVVLFIVIIGILIAINKNRKLKFQLALQISYLEQIQAGTMQENETNIDNMSVEQLQDEYKRVFNQLTKEINIDTYCVAESILSSEIYNRFKDSLNNVSLKINPNDWEALDFLINNTYNDFKLKLHQLNNKISEHEYHICLLIKCNFSNTEISYLTNRDRSSITHAKKRLYMKLFKTKGDTVDLCKFILSL